MPSQKHPPPLPADLPLEQDMVKTPGLEQYRGYSSGRPVTLIIRVLLHPPGGGLLGLFPELILAPLPKASQGPRKGPFWLPREVIFDPFLPPRGSF